MRRSSMKNSHGPKASIVLASLWLGFVFLSTEALARDKHEEKFEKTEALAKDGKVYLNNISGDIEIRTWDRDEVKIDALKVSEASSLSQAKENCGLVTIEVTKEAGLLRIETKYPHKKTFWGGDSVNVSVNYKLWIPAKASAEVKSVSGDVDLEAIGGAVKTGLVSGSVTLKKAAAGADLNTVSGELTLEDITGNVYLKTVSGDIDITRVKGSIEAETVSGGVEMREVTEAGSISAKSLSGDVIYQGKIDPRGRYTLKSHSGDLTMTIPADSAFEFDAETFSGSIESDFPVEISGKMSSRELHGVVNKGGAALRLSTFSGNIDLKKN
jgi:DUF4097 and DUF4098 domain-containing protein YvlB